MSFRYLLAALILSAVVVSPPARAQSADSGEIAVLDLNTIRRDADAVRDIRRQIAEYRKAFQSEIQNEEKALREANQELARRRSILSPEAFAAERRKFEQRVLDMQKLVQQRRENLERAQAQAMAQVEDNLNAIVREIAGARGFALVLSDVQAVVIDDNLDITKEALDRLNKSLPSVKVPEPGN